MRLIESEACIAEGSVALSACEPRFADALAQTGPLPLRRKPDGFAQLLSAILSQQVSVASANAIWARVCDAGLNDPKLVRSASEDDLRACGLSRQKISYAMALAKADIDYDALRTQSTEDVVKTLTAVPGIGRWTAEIYAMFSLGHADVFAPGDLALQEGARIIFELDKRPAEKELREMALAWSPWQAVAARLLWAYYALDKKREGIR